MQDRSSSRFALLLHGFKNYDNSRGEWLRSTESVTQNAAMALLWLALGKSAFTAPAPETASVLVSAQTKSNRHTLFFFSLLPLLQIVCVWASEFLWCCAKMQTTPNDFCSEFSSRAVYLNLIHKAAWILKKWSASVLVAIYSLKHLQKGKLKSFASLIKSSWLDHSTKYRSFAFVWKYFEMHSTTCLDSSSFIIRHCT